MAHFYLQSLLLLVLLIAISECRDPSPETVPATKEEDVVLPCFDSDVMGSCNRVKLIKYASNKSQMKVILARPQSSKFPDAERVKWQSDENGRMSLSLTKIQKSDEGVYGCEICRDWDCVVVKNISLKVRDCKILPAVKAAANMKVNLSCPANTASGQHNISWGLLRGEKVVSVNSKRAVINGAILTIHSVNYSDSEWYRCDLHKLGQSQRCFDMYLRVYVENVVVTTTLPALTATAMIQETRKETSSVTLIAVVVASVIIGLAAIAALIGLYVYRRCNAPRVTQQWQPAGTLTGFYETVSFSSPAAEGDTNQRVNSVYQPFLDEGLCTFNYK